MKDKCLGHQQISAATLASATTPTIPDGTREIWAQCATNNVRYTLDGTTTPTSTVGMQLIAGAHQPLVLTLSMSCLNVKFILESGSPTLSLMYFGQSDS